MKTVAIRLNKETKTAILYGTGNKRFLFGCHEGTKEDKALLDQIVDFVENHGYAGEVRAFSQLQKIKESELSSPNIDFFISNFWHGNESTGYLGKAQSIVNGCFDRSFFDDRMKTIKEAMAFFKEAEKDDDLDISVVVPVNCSSIDNRHIKEAKTLIQIKDNRTSVYSQSILNVLSFGNSYKTACDDFSHWKTDQFTDKNTGVILGGMDNFADAWEEDIKPLVLAEIEKCRNEKKSPEEIEPEEIEEER